MSHRVASSSEQTLANMSHGEVASEQTLPNMSHGEVASTSEQTLANMSHGEVACTSEQTLANMSHGEVASTSEQTLARVVAEVVMSELKDLTLEVRFKNVSTPEGRYTTDPNLWFCWFRPAIVVCTPRLNHHDEHALQTINKNKQSYIVS